MWSLLLVFSSLAAPGLSLAEGEVSGAAPLILAVHPYQPYKTLIGKYTPLANYLGEVLDHKVIVRIGRDYQDHLNYVGNDRVDIAVMGPASYVRMVSQYGEKPLLARFEIDGQPSFHGRIVVPKEASLHRLAELRGKRFAFGDRYSTMSHLVPRYMLQQAGVGLDDLGDYQFLGSHDNVALSVLAGDFDAGAVKEEVFEQYRDRGLRTLAVTPALSEHLFVARRGLSPTTLSHLRQALFGLRDSSRGRAILHGIKQTMTGMVPVEDADYGNLRRILRALDAPGMQ